jgi:segregation and condensation protein B
MANEPEPPAGGDWQVEVPPDAPAGGEHKPPGDAADHRPVDPGRSPRPRPVRTPPPAPEQLAEAMLFVGGRPLTAEKFCAVLRVPADVFHAAVDALNRKYKAQNRPYSVQPWDGGYALAVKPPFRTLRERLYGGPREARLTQPALDVLALVAYRQPVAKADIDALRGHDSGAVLRQLVRLGLVAVARRGESDRREVCYGTTPRFLELFGLGSLDDLPRLGDAEQV